MPAFDGRLGPIEQRASPPAQTEVVTFSEALDRMVKAAERKRTWQRDVALIYVQFCTGLYQLEISKLRVSDYLTRDGQVARISKVRAEIAIKGRERPLLWVNPRLIKAMDQYLAYRRDAKQGVGRRNSYRGLDPESRLFLKEDGTPFRIIKRGIRTEASEVRDRFGRAALEAGVKMNFREARRGLAQRLYELGGDPSGLCRIFGIQEESQLLKTIGFSREDRDRAERMSALMEMVI